MENSFKNLIDSAKSVLILLPVNPNLDQVAGALSLYLGLRDKKDVTVSCPSPMVVEFNRLVGIDKISSDLGNKNLTLKFNDYQASDIERVSYDIENGQFKLTVIPKPGVASPKKEQVEISYSGVSGDTIILVGGESQESFPALASKDTLNAKLLHIGTKALPSTEKSVLSFARPGSSISEIVYPLINEVGANLDSDVATNLLAGIEDGGKGFSGDQVTAETFETVAHLLRAGGKRPVKITPEEFPGGMPLSSFMQVEPGGEQPQQDQPAPNDWLEPKVFKGTSVS